MSSLGRLSTPAMLGGMRTECAARAKEANTPKERANMVCGFLGRFPVVEEDVYAVVEDVVVLQLEGKEWCSQRGWSDESPTKAP
jgi:hypothetical protein